MMQREREERLEGKMMFWGKVNGNENDYLVCYALATPTLEEGDFPLKKVIHTSSLEERWTEPNQPSPIRAVCHAQQNDGASFECRAYFATAAAAVQKKVTMRNGLQTLRAKHPRLAQRLAQGEGGGSSTCHVYTGALDWSNESLQAKTDTWLDVNASLCLSARTDYARPSYTHECEAGCKTGGHGCKAKHTSMPRTRIRA